MRQELFNAVFQDNLRTAQDVQHGCMILIDNKVYTDRLGKFIFRDKSAAWKSFYNSMRWHVHSYAYRNNPYRTDNPYHRSGDIAINDTEYNLLSDWVSFKKDLIDHHHCQIVYLNGGH